METRNKAAQNSKNKKRQSNRGFNSKLMEDTNIKSKE